MKLTAILGGLVLASSSIPLHITALPAAPDGTAVTYPYDASAELRAFASEEGQNAVEELLKTRTEDLRAFYLERSDFTSALINSTATEWPLLNWVVCHPAHNASFDFREHYEWKKYSQQYRSWNYDIYWFVSGTFERYGDGGYDNWAYYGSLSKPAENEGSLLTFGSMIV